MLSSKIINAQETHENTFKKTKYTVWVKTNTNTVKGSLIDLKEQSISILDYSKPIASPFLEMDINKIQTLKFRRKGGISRGSRIGALTGVGTGILLGVISGSNYRGTAGQYAALFGTVLAIPGALIGGAIGIYKVNVPIGNRKASM